MPDCGSGCRGFDPHHPPEPDTTFRFRDKNLNAFVAQLDRATDFESVGRRFESCRTHGFYIGPLAQLAEQQTLNLRVEGSKPSRLIKSGLKNVLGLDEKALFRLVCASHPRIARVVERQTRQT